MKSGACDFIAPCADQSGDLDRDDRDNGQNEDDVDEQRNEHDLVARNDGGQTGEDQERQQR